MQPEFYQSIASVLQFCSRFIFRLLLILLDSNLPLIQHRYKKLWNTTPTQISLPTFSISRALFLSLHLLLQFTFRVCSLVLVCLPRSKGEPFSFERTNERVSACFCAFVPFRSFYMQTNFHPIFFSTKIFDFSCQQITCAQTSKTKKTKQFFSECENIFFLNTCKKLYGNCYTL